MRNALRIFAVILGICMFSAGCATNDALKSEVTGLRSQVVELQKTLADTNLRMEELSNSIFILQERTKANKEALAEVTQPKIVISGDSAGPAERYLVQQDAGTPLPQGGFGADNITGSIPSEMPVQQAQPAGSSELAAAKAGFQKNNYGLAVFDLTSFLAKNPSGPEQEEALYYLGMSYFQLNEFSQAIREWNKLLGRFPQSQWAAEATYRTGISYNALGNKTTARTFFDLTVQKYPNTSWAKKAAGALGQ